MILKIEAEKEELEEWEETQLSEVQRITKRGGLQYCKILQTGQVK